MEELSILLQPYKEQVAVVTSVLTIAQFFSGSLICRDIYKQKSTEGIPSMPFIGGLFIGVLMLQYSLMLGDPAMLVVNEAATFLNFLYTLFYYSYSKNKTEEIYKPLTYGCASTVVLLGYTIWENQTLVEDRFGLILTVLMLGLMGSPLLEVKDIVAKKDSSSIPFPITSTAFIVSFLWLVYGIILLNYFMVIQNILGLAICGIQVVLCFLYPTKPLKKVD